MEAPQYSAEPSLVQRYQQVRQLSEQLAEPYSEADQTLQSMPDASPVKWHLAHTSWFFETFVLKVYQDDYSVFNSHFEYLFNSYYNSVGQQFPRAQRGVISRPGKEEVLAYRTHVDAQMHTLLNHLSPSPELTELLLLGLAHEQQHQELLVTDIQHALAINPMAPQVTQPPAAFTPAKPINWLAIEQGLYQVGANGDGFSFDNEGPRHQVFIAPFSVADRLVTNAEYLQFMAAGGYQEPSFWLSEGWAWLHERNVVAPLYWQQQNQRWLKNGLAGLQVLDPHAPVTHISYFEANAYACWAKARLATEFEWEIVAQHFPEISHEYDPAVLAPQPSLQNGSGISQLFNTLWQWTASQYLPYPGFKVAEGAVGEYNGKFMSNQFVLRGGSSVTPVNHIRATYRNFFPATTRWQFSGIRLVKDD